MKIKKIGSAALDAWVETLAGMQKVYGPQQKGDRFDFAPLTEAKDLRLDFDVSLTPPKKFFQPERETLLKFDSSGFHSTLQSEPFVLFGVHPYDMAAIMQMDKVFADGNYDTHYMARRCGATIVVSDVVNPSTNNFAGCMNTAFLREGGDVMLTRLDDGHFLAESRSEAGAKLMDSLAGAPDAEQSDVDAREALWAGNAKRLRAHELKVKPTELPALLEKNYEHPVWEEKAEMCFSCGSCNLVCPTCYCFDVHDEVNWDLQSGERVRAWDGCMLTDFATVAGNHNFRKKKGDRFRHRYYRKGKYLWDKFEQIACVGCGRCISACVSKIANPVEIYNRLAEGK